MGVEAPLMGGEPAADEEGEKPGGGGLRPARRLAESGLPVHVGRGEEKRCDYGGRGARAKGLAPAYVTRESWGSAWAWAWAWA